MRAGALSLILVSALAAGCIGDGGDAELNTDGAGSLGVFSPPAPDFDFTDAIDAAHPDHHLPQLHTEVFGLSLAGHTNFMGFHDLTEQAGWTDIDVHGDLVVVAGISGFRGVTLVDISDPANPTPLSKISSAGAEWDARFSDDGQYLFFGCQTSRTAMSTAELVGDCKGDTMPHAPQEVSNMVIAYDISDPVSPVLAGHTRTAGAHNLDAVMIDGEHYVFTDGTDILQFTPGASVEEALQVVAEVPGVHDAMVALHPVTGQWLMYTGSGGTFTIYDVSNPAEPDVVLEQGPDVVAWHEQTVSRELIDGRVILATAGEVYSGTGQVAGPLNDPLDKMFIIDVTDPTAPEVLSEWELPITTFAPWASYRWSPHDIDISPYGQIAIAWYHAGVWVVDVSTQERQSEPVTLGFYQPHELPPAQLPETFWQTEPLVVPMVWAAYWTDEGRLVIPDMATGLYVLEPEWGLFP